MSEENKNESNILEDIAIMKMVKERDARDTGKRYSYEEVVDKINKRLEGENKEDSL